MMYRVPAPLSVSVPHDRLYKVTVPRAKPDPRYLLDVPHTGLYAFVVLVKSELADTEVKVAFLCPHGCAPVSRDNLGSSVSFFALRDSISTCDFVILVCPPSEKPRTIPQCPL